MVLVMSPNEREWGALETRLDQLIHTQRNMRTIIELMDENCKALETDVARIKVMMRTTLSIVAVEIASLVWVVEMIFR
tara:strand:- start:814 stop:1047 length:234 start_codon:yes stop_codon:yes gene_type:complete